MKKAPMAADDAERKARRDACPSELDLEMFAFGPELEASDSRLALHVAGCTFCRAQAESMKSARSDFLAERPPPQFMSELASWKGVLAPHPANDDDRAPRSLASWRSRWLPLSVVAAAALALVAVLPGLWRGDAADELGVHFRGAAQDLTVYVSRGGRAALPLADREGLHAGDVLRFGIRTAEPGYVAIVNVDGRGRVTRYLPQATTPMRVAAGTTLLEGSIRLDDYVGEELVALVFARAPLDHGQLVSAFEEAYTKTAGNLAQLQPPALPAEFTFRMVTKLKP